MLIFFIVIDLCQKKVKYHKFDMHVESNIDHVQRFYIFFF
jgi:hypothetical protein